MVQPKHINTTSVYYPTFDAESVNAIYGELPRAARIAKRKIESARATLQTSGYSVDSVESLRRATERFRFLVRHHISRSIFFIQSNGVRPSYPAE